MMEQFSEFPNAYAELMERLKIGLNAAEGQAHCVAQVANQAYEPHPQPTLVEDLAAQVERGRLPALAPGTPAFDDVMFDDLNRLRLGQFKHLAASSKRAAVEMEAAVGAVVKGMLLSAGRKVQAAGMVVLRVALLAWQALCLGRVGFDKGRRVRRLVLQLGDTSESSGQLRMKRSILLTQGSELLA